VAGPADVGPPGQDSADAGTPEKGPAGSGPSPAGKPRPRWRRALLETVVILLAALLAAGLIRTYAFQTFFIPSSSMVPTLEVHDRIIAQKAFFNWHDVRQGDIVVFTHPPLDTCGGSEESGDLVKRVIALPGQTIYSEGNSIYVDGRLLSEPYLPKTDPLGPAIPDASKQQPYRVPAGEFYMMGDNRAISCDSRYWGPIEGSSMVGKVVLVWWRDGHPYFRGL
jgi:signal peptidase I